MSLNGCREELRRGQASTEYLVVVAVVFILALVVVDLIGGFSVSSPAVSERQSLSYWSGTDIGLSKPFFGNGSAGKVVVRNNKPFSIRFINLTDSHGIPLSSSGNLNRVLAPGEIVNVSTNPSGFPCNGSVVGSFYSVDLVAWYGDAAVSSSVRHFNGELALVGVCMGSGGGVAPYVDQFPYVSFSFPSSVLAGSVFFNASCVDDFGKVSNFSLWGNWSGWGFKQQNSSAVASGVSYNFSSAVSLGQGRFSWSARCCDNASQCVFGLNQSLSVVYVDQFPSVSLSYPSTGFVGARVFNATCSDDLAVAGLSLWGNFSGASVSLVLNQSNSSVVQNNTRYDFSSVTLPAGTFAWSARCCDNVSQCSFGVNRSIVLSAVPDAKKSLRRRRTCRERAEPAKQ